MDVERVVDRMVAEIPGLAVVYLFGSAARGDAVAGSDVDLVDLRSASTVMRVQVIASGRVLHERSAFERDAFEAAALGAYARLNDARRGILEDVQRRGRVYG